MSLKHGEIIHYKYDYRDLQEIVYIKEKERVSMNARKMSIVS